MSGNPRTTTNLQPIDPEEAYLWYLEQKEQDCSGRTIEAHRYRLGHFVDWCSGKEIDNLNDLTGRHIQRYRTWRKNDGDLNNVSLHTQLGTLRVFLKWCESIEAVTPGLYDKIVMPVLKNGEGQRDKKINPDQAFKLMNYLRKFEYASTKHVVFELMWHTAARVGGIRALDVTDYYPREAYIEFKHRPGTDTPLKNGENGERPVAINDEMCTLLDDYLDHTRKDRPDSFGRDPLITSRQGRPSTETLRPWIYQITQPCYYTGKCPVDKDPESCQYQSYDHLSKCPEKMYPHAIRRGSLTYHLLRDWSKEDLGERADVSNAVLEKHYDRRTDKEKLDRRRSNVTKL